MYPRCLWHLHSDKPLSQIHKNSIFSARGFHSVLFFWLNRHSHLLMMVYSFFFSRCCCCCYFICTVAPFLCHDLLYRIRFIFHYAKYGQCLFCLCAPHLQLLLLFRVLLLLFVFRLLAAVASSKWCRRRFA